MVFSDRFWDVENDQKSSVVQPLEPRSSEYLYLNLRELRSGSDFDEVLQHLRWRSCQISTRWQGTVTYSR